MADAVCLTDIPLVELAEKERRVIKGSFFPCATYIKPSRVVMNFTSVEAVCNWMAHSFFFSVWGQPTVQWAMPGGCPVLQKAVCKPLNHVHRRVNIFTGLLFACRASDSPREVPGDGTSDDDGVEDDFDALSFGLSIWQEYKTLSQVPELNPKQAQRLAMILELAAHDRALARWIEKSDEELMGLSKAMTQEVE